MAEPTREIDPENIRALHAALVANRMTLDQLLWQAPVISLTAQAFLLTLAFSNGAEPFYAKIAGILSALIGLLSWQLFLRHAYLEVCASKKLEEFELEHFGLSVHQRPTNTGIGFDRWRSRPFWAFGLFVVSLAGFLPFFR